jgi:PAS domain S-box-containing protein
VKLLADRLRVLLEKDGKIFPLLLLLPVAALFLITLSGYLYFSYQQLRQALAEEEYHLVSQVASNLDEQLSTVRFELLDMARSLQALRLDELQASELDGLTGRFDSVLANNRNYAAIVLLDSAGTILTRSRRTGTEFASVELADLLSADSGFAGTSARSLLAQPITSFFMLLFDDNGIVEPHVPLLISILPLGEPQQPQGTLITAYQAGPMLDQLQAQAEQSRGDLWLLTNTGYWISGGAEDDFGFLFPQQAARVAQRYPEVWAAVMDGEERALTIDSGVVSQAKVCGRLSCPSAIGAEETVPGDWVLLSFVANAQLAVPGLLTSNTGHWLPMLTLLLVVSLISATGAWYLGVTTMALRRNERNLRQANILQEAFFEKNPEIMFVKNLDGSYTLANEMCRELSGYPDRDFTAGSTEEVFPNASSEAVSQQDIQVIQSEEAMEFHSQWSRDGTITHYKTLRFPMYDDSGELVAIGGIANDITDQVMSRHALLENERLLRTFIESAPDAVLISDEQGQITLVNRQAELIFEYDREEMLQLTLFDLVSDLNRTRLKETMEMAGRDDKEVFREAMEAVGHGKRNRNFPVEFSLAPVKTEEGSLVICLLRDNSEKALMETQLRQSQKMEAVGKLTGGMAHDFNNLLGIIIGNLALALKKSGGDERLEKRINTCMKAANRGAELTKRMLAIARRQPLQPKPVSINRVIEELSLMLPQTLGSDIEMELQLTPELPNILVDESEFEGMLLNLAINSRDAMPEGGRFSIRTYLKDRESLRKILPQTQIKNARFVHIMVKDNGEGMSEEALNRAFEPFFTTKEKDKGTGLGLAMIYGFIKQSKGFIVLDSKLGRGTSVHIYLPVPEELAIDQTDSKTGSQSATPEGRNRLVLLVDDEYELLQIAQAYLEEMGFRVVTATSGQLALDKLAGIEEPALLLTDVVMPGGMNGVSLVRQVREKYPTIPVLYASGYPSGIIEENARTEMDAPLISKPYTFSVLAQAISAVLEDR